MNTINNTDFWLAIDKLVSDSKVVIDRTKGSQHPGCMGEQDAEHPTSPKYPDYVYPLDYGYLEGTSAMDGGSIDVWKGSDGHYIDAIICTVDLLKRDSM